LGDCQWKYELWLFVSGHTPQSERALANLTQICEQHIEGRHELIVVDVLQHPDAAAEERIMATPTLVKKLPAPLCRIIGDLSDTEKVLSALDVGPVKAPGS
jgi:circadian clock protein KaiB